MKATELYEQLVTGITDSLLNEAERVNSRGIQGVRLSPEDVEKAAAARRQRAPMEPSENIQKQLGELRTALDSGNVTRKDGSVVKMHPEIRKRMQAEHDRIVGAMGGNPLIKGREAASKALDAIMVAPEPEERKPTGEEAFNALFK